MIFLSFCAGFSTLHRGFWEEAGKWRLIGAQERPVQTSHKGGGKPGNPFRTSQLRVGSQAFHRQRHTLDDTLANQIVPHKTLELAAH
jgi:hypothetical protein